MGQSKSQLIRALRSIRMIWWGCFGGIFLYSSTAVAIGGLPLGEGLKAFDLSEATIFLSALVSSLIAVSVPFTLLGRGYVRRRRSSRQAVLTSALLRLALAEVAVIVGVAVFVETGSFEMYLPFPLMSALSLLRLKGEEDFYRDVLLTVQEE